VEPDVRPLEEAAGWFVRLRAEDVSEQDQQAWQHWLASSELNRQAWLRVERMQAVMQRAPAQARRALASAGVQRRRRVLACAGLLLTAGAVWQGLGRLAAPPPVQWLSTLPGQRRAWQLPDGTRLMLGAASRVGIDFRADRRDLLLQEGFLQVSSGHQPAYAERPLRVLARDGVIEPLGTRFTLVQGAQHSELAVQEAVVALHQPLPGLAPIRLAAGQRVRFFASGAGHIESAGPGDDAWTRGLLVVLEQPLVEFVTALARQSGVSIACDPALPALRVSGTYLVDDVARSLQSLTGVLPVQVSKTPQGYRLLPVS
jgi:transmembrane sensor